MTKEYKSFIFTGDKTTCSGCGACCQICKHTAISMMADEEGFLYPTLDSEKCIKCGLCDITCPAVGNDRANAEQKQSCFIATTKEKKYSAEGASIGLCTMLSDKIIEQGGVVFGCYLDENIWSAYHKCVDSKEGVMSIRNSKYLQSDTRHTFTEVRTYIEQNRQVLYIGTPCEIAGLKAFLKKDYQNLYTIDIVCHGTFSPKLMPLEVEYWEKKYGGKICNFRFRSKRIYKRINGGMVNFDLIREGRKSRHIEQHATASPSYRCYAYSEDGRNYNLRLSCYNCKFRAKTRYADITIGDPWFIPDSIINDKLLESKNVIRSLYSANTEKGKNLLGLVSHYLHAKEFSRDESFIQPAVLPVVRQVPAKRKQLYESIGLIEYSALVEELLGCNLKKAHRKFLYDYMKKYIKKYILSR